MTWLLGSPVELLTGVPIAVLFGVAAAALVGIVSFLTAAGTTGTVSPLGGGLATAAITGSLLYTAGIVDPGTVRPGPVLGCGLACILGLYATSQGTQLAGTLPQATVGSIERGQPLAADAIDAVDAMGQVTIRSSGDVRAFEGYPPLDPGLRATIEAGAWRLPADLPLAALETRLEARLRTTHDLEAVSVTIDRRGRATITAAPPEHGVSTHVSEGQRAVSVRALLPTGLTAGDTVRVHTDSEAVSGTVCSVSTDVAVADGGMAQPAHPPARDRPAVRTDTTAPTASGEGRVTVAVPTIDAATLLAADRARIVVTPLETTAAFEAVSLLDRGGVMVRMVTVTDRVLDAVADEDTDLAAFAVRRPGRPASDMSGWEFEPPADTLQCGMQAIVVGSDTAAVERMPDDPEPRVKGVSH